MTETHRFYYASYDTSAGMPAPDRELVAAARAARETAYAPHTGFRVGAAARLRSGKVIAASNQESVVGPAGVCAERNLLYNHQANHADDPIESVAIASDPDTGEVYPCGMCRQVLADSEDRQGVPIRVIMSGRDSATVVHSSYDLLPFRFKIV